MANKRLIDGNALLESHWWDTIRDEFDKARAKLIVQTCPTVDAVEVVHCCDCRNCTAFQQFADSEVILFCEKWKGHPKVDPTDFCSYGERRNDG